MIALNAWSTEMNHPTHFLNYRSYDPAARARERCVLRKLEGATRWGVDI